MDKIIEAVGLKKSYGSTQAVKGIDFYVESGKLFAFLGPNGAGKSTTIDIICTTLKPDSGRVVIDGHGLGQDDEAIRSSIGVVFQDGLLDPLLTVSENLKVRGCLYGLKGKQLLEAVEKAAKAGGVNGFLNRPYGKLSGGQRRRADIARALVNTPKILFLDEPTTGLDPQTRKNVWDTIQTLQKETGMTVFMTTHYMEEAAQADYVIVIDDGMIAAKGLPAELKAKYASDALKLRPLNSQELCRTLTADGIACTNAAGQVIIKIDSTMEAIPLLERYKENIKGFEVVSGTMDDAFISITGKEIRE